MNKRKNFKISIIGFLTNKLFWNKKKLAWGADYSVGDVLFRLTIRLNSPNGVKKNDIGFWNIYDSTNE